MSLHKSLHQARYNKNNIKFKYLRKNVLPPTCDTIIKNLVNNPLHHLSLINHKNVTPLFKDTSDLSDIKLKKIGSQLTKNFSAEINHKTNLTQSEKLVDFLNEVESLSVDVDGSYTMQPIIVDTNDFSDKSKYTLLAGQQRITHIYMILKYLESSNRMLDACKSSTDLLNKHFLAMISYQDWDSFLYNIQLKDNFINDNLSQVYQTLHNWFAKKSMVEQEIWKKKLLNHTKFIWYITDNDSFASEKMQKMGGVVNHTKFLS